MTDRSAVSEERSDEANLDEQDLLDIGREEARQTLDHQIRTLNDIDTKASKILRLNVALLSLLLMGASVLANSSSYHATELLTPLSLTGIGSLLVSTVFAGLTYTSSEFRGGLGPDDLRIVLDCEYDDEQLHEALLASYADWIEFNDDTNVRNEPLITLTIVWAVYAVTFLTLGVLDVFLGSVPGYVVLLAVTALFVFTLSADLPSQLSRWHKVVEPTARLRRKTLEFAERLSNTRGNERP